MPSKPTRSRAIRRDTGDNTTRALFEMWRANAPLFAPCMQELMDAGDMASLNGVVEHAGVVGDQEMQHDISGDILALSDSMMVEGCDGVQANLCAVVVVMAGSEPPDTEAFVAALKSSGCLEPWAEVVFAPTWIAIDDMAAMDVCTVRAILRSMVAGQQPQLPSPGLNAQRTYALFYLERGRLVDIEAAFAHESDPQHAYSIRAAHAQSVLSARGLEDIEDIGIPGLVSSVMADSGLDGAIVTQQEFAAAFAAWLDSVLDTLGQVEFVTQVTMDGEGLHACLLEPADRGGRVLAARDFGIHELPASPEQARVALEAVLGANRDTAATSNERDEVEVRPAGVTLH